MSPTIITLFHLGVVGGVADTTEWITPFGSVTITFVVSLSSLEFLIAISCWLRTTRTIRPCRSRSAGTLGT